MVGNAHTYLVALLLEERHLHPDDGLLERRQRLLDIALLPPQQVGTDLLVELVDLVGVGQRAEVAVEVVERLEDRLVRVRVRVQVRVRVRGSVRARARARACKRREVSKGGAEDASARRRHRE